MCWLVSCTCTHTHLPPVFALQLLTPSNISCSGSIRIAARVLPRKVIHCPVCVCTLHAAGWKQTNHLQVCLWRCACEASAAFASQPPWPTCCCTCLVPAFDVCGSSRQLWHQPTHVACVGHHWGPMSCGATLKSQFGDPNVCSGCGLQQYQHHLLVRSCRCVDG